MDNKELLENFIRESLIDENVLIEEGIMDWLFSRWRKGGDWIKNSSGNRFEDILQDLRRMYSAADKIKDAYPRASRRIKKSIQRIMLDFDNVNIMISKGVDEKSFLKGEID